MMRGAGASNPTLPLIPIMVSPTWMSLPMAYSPAREFRATMASMGDSCSSSRLFNSPASNERDMIFEDSFISGDGYASSGSARWEVKVSSPPGIPPGYVF